MAEQISGKSKSFLATKCLICGEAVPMKHEKDYPKICDECRRAMLAIRKQYKIINVQLPEENNS